MAFFATFASAALAGNFFATGHDQDFHCYNGDPNECAYYKLTTTFVRNSSTLPILILDRSENSGTDEAVDSLNLAYSNDASSSPTASSPPYVVEDPEGVDPTMINGTPPPGISKSSKFASTPLVGASGAPLWSAIIIASDESCGGCDLNAGAPTTHVDSDAINARASDIHTYFNDGGGLLYLAGAEDAYDANNVSGNDVYYKSVPVPLGGEPVSSPFTVTSEGAGLGITSDMVNCCATHNSFDLPASGSDLEVAETDSAGLAESLFIKGGSVCSSGFCKQPPGKPPRRGSTSKLTSPTVPIVFSTFQPRVTTGTGTAAELGGVVDPENLETVAHFEIGLDPRYTGGGPVVYTQSTPYQVVGSDFSVHTVVGSVSGLVPNTLYHVRLVATNADGTVDGPDVTFLTAKQPVPAAPTLGQTADVYPISGQVFIKPPSGEQIHGVRAVTSAVAPFPKGQGFIPLTQARQIPIGSQIDAMRGTLAITLATGHARTTESATLNGSVFGLGQSRSGRLKGLTTFTLTENAFKGAPSYSSCSTAKTTLKPTPGTFGPLAQIAKLSSKVLQTLHASDHGGKFRTRGRYSAATVRGTDWLTEDRCDGTLTKVKRGSVNVLNYHTRKTIIVKAGHSYLAQRF